MATKKSTKKTTQKTARKTPSKTPATRKAPTKKKAKRAPKAKPSSRAKKPKKKVSVPGLLPTRHLQKTPIFSEWNTERKWFLIDLEGKVVGRAASTISRILRGKNKPIFTPHADTGDFIIAINAAKARFSGRKWQNKMYHHYSGYLGGLKSISAEKLQAKSPETLFRKAVWGMLPKNALGRRMLKKLKIYSGKEHPHSAQKPEILQI